MSLKKSAKISEKTVLGVWQSPKDCDSCSTCWQRLSLCWFPSPGDNCRCTDGEKSRQARVFADENLSTSSATTPLPRNLSSHRHPARRALCRRLQPCQDGRRPI